MVATRPVSLAAGHLRLELSPSVGGSISSFARESEGRTIAILRKCHSGSQNVLDAACFPLVPYSNRIRGGQFSFRGREVRLTPNMAGDPSPLHGQGWLGRWTVEEAGESRALLRFEHQPGEWPWRYQASQEFALDQGGLSVQLTCRNLSDEPMPCGLGLHPYFRCGPQTRLDTKVATAWTIDEDVLPMAQVPAEGRFDLSNRLVCGQDLDNGFGGWSGRATMTDPGWGFALVMSSPQARFFQLYSPGEGGLYVAEPVSHANAALNAPEERWAELGLRVLESGGAMQLDMRIDVAAG